MTGTPVWWSETELREYLQTPAIADTGVLVFIAGGRGIWGNGFALVGGVPDSRGARARDSRGRREYEASEGCRAGTTYQKC